MEVGQASCFFRASTHERNDMDNVTRSERSRKAALQAALTIIARDGPGRLTLDAIARESGLSKGGLMHQFRTKDAVLKALLDHQTAYFEDFYRGYIAEHGGKGAQPELAAQIATLREVNSQPDSVVFAVFGALARNPDLLSASRDIDARKIAAIKAEAADSQLAVLRWSAAMGLALTTMMGMCPLSEKEREQLYERLLDDEQWAALETPAKPPVKPSASRPSRAGASRRR
jgi:AcrR family transcriptional regulator